MCSKSLLRVSAIACKLTCLRSCLLLQVMAMVQAGITPPNVRVSCSLSGWRIGSTRPRGLACNFHQVLTIGVWLASSVCLKPFGQVLLC